MRVGVLFGGASVEHDISLVTASQIMASLEGEEYEVIPLYLEKNGKIVVTEKFLSQKDLKDKRIKFSESDEKRFKGKIWANFKEKKRVDVILPAIHGKFLEGGEIYGFCKTMHIPYAFSNCLASSISQSKIFTKKLSKFVRSQLFPIYRISSLILYCDFFSSFRMVPISFVSSSLKF